MLTLRPMLTPKPMLTLKPIVDMAVGDTLATPDPATPAATDPTGNHMAMGDTTDLPPHTMDTTDGRKNTITKINSSK